MGKLARLDSIDLARGMVIALMALDHVRDYFGLMATSPEDLAHTTPGWFWTRWITHLCATVFVLLAGSSAFLRGEARGIAALSRYLAVRGALLIVLDATWITFSWYFEYKTIILQVLWALGWGMLLLAVLARLPRLVVMLVAVLLILPHNALDQWHPAGALWKAWHDGGYVPLGGGFGVAFMYPLMPWLGLMAAGYALGPVFLWERQRRMRFLLGAATLLAVAFAALRAANLYGDPDPWSPLGRGAMFDLMSFMRVHKYPPSLLYLCVTGSIGLFLLALLERARGPRVLAVFGRTPMFFYVVHIALVHVLAGAYYVLRFGALPSVTETGLKLPPGYVPSLAVVYAAWAGVLALMYALTLLWMNWRARRVVQPVPVAA